MGLLDARVIQRNEETGATDWYHYNAETGGFTVEHVQDCEPTIEHNKTLVNAAARDWKGDMQHVATIPLVVLEDLRKRGILADQKAYKKWLNDPDNRYFRTHEGKV